MTGPGQARSALAGRDAPARDTAPLPAAVLAVDAGNRKTDLVLVAADGTLMGAVRGPTASHQAVGLERGLDRLVELAARAAAATGDRPATLAARDRPVPATPIARVGAFCLAGADTPRDVRRLTRAIGRRGLVADVLVRNDTDAAPAPGRPMGGGRAGLRRGVQLPRRPP